MSKVLRRSRPCLWAVLTVLVASVLSPAGTTAATLPIVFDGVWARTDLPVTTAQVQRTWMWGPQPDTAPLTEPYAEAPGGKRTVQYFDKTRMEDNSYRASSPWDVTNGLLAEELITGRLQVGDNAFEQRSPAQVNVAGDPNDPNGPTYATLNGLTSNAALPSGATITQTVDRAGQVGDDPSLASYGVTAQDVGAPTHHAVASVFWAFMNATGPVSDDGQTMTGPLFPNAFYATGYPLTEAYWTHVLVGGVSKLVLVQVFERRVLTYTPDNPAGWQVEAGNVGLHYYAWRYGLATAPTPGALQPPTTNAAPPPPATNAAPPPPTTNAAAQQQQCSQSQTVVNTDGSQVAEQRQSIVVSQSGSSSTQVTCSQSSLQLP